MAEITLIKKIPFRLYLKKDGTWQGYCRLSKKHFHRKTKESLLVMLNQEADRLRGDTLGQTFMSALEWQEYNAALTTLSPFKASLSDAVNFFASQQKKIANPLTVAAAIDGFQKAKINASRQYKAFIRQNLGKLSNEFGDGQMAESAEVMVGWLRKNKFNGRGFNNLRGLLITFWRWCQKEGITERDATTPFDRVDLKKETNEEITVLSPLQLHWLLHGLGDDVLTWVRLGAFYGLRAAEIERLEGHDVDLAHGVIEVAADKAKTGQRRLAPINKLDHSWLSELAHKNKLTGYLPQRRLRLVLRKRWEICGPMPLASWPKNVLRHSWISYKLAETGNVDQVASWAGTSREKIFKNYRALRTLDGLPVTQDLAGEWFGVDTSAWQNHSA
jgi:site-specific recombinase XerD